MEQIREALNRAQQFLENAEALAENEDPTLAEHIGRVVGDLQGVIAEVPVSR